MKKHSRILTTIAVIATVALSCLAFTACGGEKPAKVAETYSQDVSYSSFGAQGQEVVNISHIVLTLNDDGTYMLIDTRQVYANGNSGGHNTFTVFGTYTKTAEDADDPDNTIFNVTLEKATRIIWNDSPAWSTPKYVDTDDTNTYMEKDGVKLTFDEQVAACVASSVWSGAARAYGGTVSVDKNGGKIVSAEFTPAPNTSAPEQQA